MRLIAILSLSLLIGACTQTVAVQAGNTGSHWLLPPVGSVIKLHQSLEVPGGQTRIFLQRGKTVSKQGFDRYQPNCNFEIRSLSQQSRRIEPEAFLVTRVQREVMEVVERDEQIRLVALGFFGFDDGLSMITRNVHLWISSDLQPDVMRLTCRGAFADSADADPPSVLEMREALGDVATLSLPDTAAH